MRPIFIKSLFTSLLFFAMFIVHAQELLSGNDLSKIKVDLVSDADIMKFQDQLKSSGISIDKAEQMALSKGMPPAEINKLKERLSKLGTATAGPAANSSSILVREQVKEEVKTVAKPPSAASGVLGSELFTNASLSFEPNLRIAIPSDYILGADDELQITVYGYQEATYKLQILPEGNVIIPQNGVLHIAGMSIDAATKLIKQKLAKSTFQTLASGQSNLTITLSKIKSIHVTILGSFKPGNYTVSSLSTVFNALFLCGGPNEMGSYRDIQLIRNQKVYKKIDLYKFLQSGDISNNVGLKEGDVILIPPYKKRVSINGEVKRPGLYELLDNENFNDLVAFANGFTDNAYTNNIKVRQLNEDGRVVKDLSKSVYQTYIPNRSDEITIKALIDRLENSVTIEGPVYRPGDYEYTEGLTLKGLIQKADGVKKDIFYNRGLLIRTKEDLSTQAIPFDLKAILGGTSKDISLQKRDVIKIASINDFKDQRNVTINGPVRKPGSYPFNDSLSLKDVLFQAGGFTEAASVYKIEVSRRVNRSDDAPSTDTIATVLEIQSDRDLSLNSMNFLLKPFDVISVRNKTDFSLQKSISVEGEVMYPGNYTIQSKTERISSILKRCGGFTSSAYPEGVYLIRKTNNESIVNQVKIEKVKSFQSNIKDTTSDVLDDVTSTNSRIALNIKKIMESPGDKEDIILEDGDMLSVPKIDLLVKVSGEVYSNGKISYDEGKSLKYYLNHSGGVTYFGKKSKTYVVYANGDLNKTKTYLLGIFKNYPKIEPGTEIIVPRKPNKKQASTGEIIAVSTALLSTTVLLVTLIRSF